MAERKYLIRTVKLLDGYLARCEPSNICGFGADPRTALGVAACGLAFALLREKLTGAEYKKVGVKVEHT